MTKTTSKRLISLVLVLLMALSVFPTFAAAEATKATEGKSSLKDISDSLNSKPYSDYQEQYASVPRAKKEIIIKAADYDTENTTAEVSVVRDYEGKSGESLMVGDTGIVTWKVNVPEDGLYAIRTDYISVTDKTNSIERVFYINGTVPFAEARYLLLKKSWVNHYAENGRFELDVNGNELRPRAYVLHEWQEYELIDSNGYYANPFEFYFTKGENTIAFEGVREPVILNTITLYPYEDKISYEEYVAGKTEAVAEPIHLNAEMPSKTSDFTIYPIYDRKSAISEPQDAAKIMLNSIGSEKWQTPGQWIEYEFDIESAGLYEIVFRYRQDELSGMYTSRRIYIDGEVPFEEANYIKFNYDSKWQVEAATDEATTFEFYFEPGKHTLRLEVTLGEMGPIVRKVTNIMKAINNDYLEILKLTGAEPDEYRDYGFGRVLPDVVIDLLDQSNNLYDVISYVENMANIKSENSATLEQIARVLQKMGTNESEIAKNIGELKSDVGTLGEWVNTVKNQPVEIDWIDIQPASAEKKVAEAGFFKSFWYEIKQFFVSFFTDYNSLGASDEDEKNKKSSEVEVWVTTGRDQAQIMRNLIDNNFSPNNDVNANLKLVAGGTLLPSVLAGVGPDVALPGAGADPIQYAIRSAVLALNPEAYEDEEDEDEDTIAYNADMREVFSNFGEVTQRFEESALIPLTLYGKTYGLPDGQSWPMMFYRTDILADLGVDVPETWDDLLALIPVLQFNNMTLGMPSGATLYIYQRNGQLWADDGMRINLDSNLSLEAFETMTNMFTQYSLPVTFDAANRFRTGEMPIFISDYTTYNNIIIFATEIAGLWEFGPIPGTRQPDGSINNVAIGSTSALVMMRGVHDPKAAWTFMCWYTDKDFQVDYSNELVALLGPAGKNATANIEALEELPWTSREYSQLMKQMDNTTGIPNYPGSYIIDRYTQFAFNAAYNNSADPVDSLLGNINAINKEVTRKRTEFNLETLEIGQTLASKRLGQAAEAIEALEDYKDTKEVAAASAAIESEDIEELRAAAAGLSTSVPELKEIAGYLTDAANALESYINK